MEKASLQSYVIEKDNNVLIAFTAIIAAVFNLSSQ